MGRGRGKGRKLTANHEDIGSGQQGEKIPDQKRRGRPQKPKKDEIDEEEVEKLEEDDENQNISTGLSSREMCTTAAAKDGKKRKGNSKVKEKPSLMKDENGVGILMIQLNLMDFDILGAEGKASLAVQPK